LEKSVFTQCNVGVKVKYAILIYESADDFASRSNASAATYWAGWTAYTKALQEAGVMTGGAALEPSETASTVRFLGGERQVHDGPYADSKEQLGGFYLIDVQSLSDAIQWANRCPAAAHGAVEVRPLMNM
jgi:hypothetical protein